MIAGFCASVIKTEEMVRRAVRGSLISVREVPMRFESLMGDASIY